jgi:hypothetical protein
LYGGDVNPEDCCSRGWWDLNRVGKRSSSVGMIIQEGGVKGVDGVDMCCSQR